MLDFETPPQPDAGAITLPINWRWLKNAWGNGTDYRLTRWLFLRYLGLVYLVAFLSFGLQVRGLIGKNGIAPIANLLPFVRDAYPGMERLLRFPTLAWVSASDGFLQFLCFGGVVLSILLILRVAPALMLALLWMFYLSLVTAGQVFMSFQWDILLLEAGFLAIFLAPLNLRPSLISPHPPSPLVIWLFRWLLFRLLFASGIVKLNSGDPTWHNLTALAYHFETQPLPTPLAWYMHHLPAWFHQAATGAVFFFELAVPFLFLLPGCLRHVRFIGAGLTVLFQILILLTGNYTFFNWLTIGLCILLLDDSFLARFMPKKIKDRLAEPSPPMPRFQQGVITLAAGLILFLSTPLFWSQVFQQRMPVYREVAALRLTSTYGLFAVMTTSRPEVIIEGSMDGETWQEYGLRHQPQKLTDMPTIIAPFQPRLDWQLWFAALGTYDRNPWFVSFLRRLLEGSPEVLALMDSNPFPDEPPRYVRARLYDYAFTDWQTRRETGQWWQRDLRGDYVPAVSLENFRQP